MRPARGAHIVIRGLGWKQREDRGSKMASGRSLYSRCFLACNYLPESHGWHTARSLVRCFASLCKRVLPLPHHVPGQPAGRSLARSLVRSLVHSLVHPSIYTLRRRFCPSVPGPGVRRGPEFHRKSLGYIFTSGAIKAVGVRRFLD